MVDAPKLALRDFELAVELDSKNGDAYNGRGFARQPGPPPRGRSKMPRKRFAWGRRRRDCSTTPRGSTPSARALVPQRALELIQQALACFPKRSARFLVDPYSIGRGHGRARAVTRHSSRLDAELSHRK